MAMNLTTAQESLILQNILPGTIGLLFISLGGYFGNIVIVVATIHSKKLVYKCNILIALLAGADLIAQMSQLLYFHFVFTGTLVKRFNQCFYMMLPSQIAMNFGTPLIWMIGVDRILSVTQPVKYMKWRKLPYTLFMISPGVCYAILFIGIGWHSATDELTLCFMPESWGPGAKNDWVGSTVMFNALVVATYTFLLVIVRRRSRKQADGNQTQRSNPNDDINRRLLKAIVIIMLFEFFGWFVTMSSMGIAIGLGATFETIFYIEVYAGWLVNISIACNFYVYYYNSTEYRTAFKNVLCFWRDGTSQGGSWATVSSGAALPNRAGLRPSPK